MGHMIRKELAILARRSSTPIFGKFDFTFPRHQGQHESLPPNVQRGERRNEIATKNESKEKYTFYYLLCLVICI